jgi:uncharacterized protein (TIGR02145 family)
MKKVLLSLALSFSLSFAFTAADVYGVWCEYGDFDLEISGSLTMASIRGDYNMPNVKSSKFSGDCFRFSKDDFNDNWRFNQGKITFPSSYMQCQLISSKVMDCDIPAGYGFKKQTLKKAGTIAQFEAQLKKGLEEQKKKDEKEKLEKERQKQEEERQRQEEERREQEEENQKREEKKEQAEKLRKEISYKTFNFGGEDYPTIKVGNTIWMAKNLNLPADKSVCYDNKPENCKKYGRLYNWETANKVCPSGWHLPSTTEWGALTDFAGGEDEAAENLKATSGWDEGGNGMDIGFSALPGGTGYDDGGYSDGYQVIYTTVSFDNNNISKWWSNTDRTKRAARGNYSYNINGHKVFMENVGGSGRRGPPYLSVRCVQD